MSYVEPDIDVEGTVGFVIHMVTSKPYSETEYLIRAGISGGYTLEKQ